MLSWGKHWTVFSRDWRLRIVWCICIRHTSCCEQLQSINGTHPADGHNFFWFLWRHFGWPFNGGMIEPCLPWGCWPLFGSGKENRSLTKPIFCVTSFFLFWPRAGEGEAINICSLLNTIVFYILASSPSLHFAARSNVGARPGWHSTLYLSKSEWPKNRYRFNGKTTLPQSHVRSYLQVRLSYHWKAWFLPLTLIDSSLSDIERPKSIVVSSSLLYTLLGGLAHCVGFSELDTYLRPTWSARLIGMEKQTGMK